jgi:hypothetical protein
VIRAANARLRTADEPAVIFALPPALTCAHFEMIVLVSFRHTSARLAWSRCCSAVAFVGAIDQNILNVPAMKQLCNVVRTLVGKLPPRPGQSETNAGETRGSGRRCTEMDLAAAAANIEAAQSRHQSCRTEDPA